MNVWNQNRNNDADQPDEREWQAQEQALRDERLGIAASGSDAPDAHYRTIARALSEPPADALPADFARRVAGLATKQTAAAGDATPFEKLMLNALGTLLVVSGLLAMAMYGSEALAEVDARIVHWGLALAACAALSWSLDWVRQQFGREDDLHHA